MLAVTKSSDTNDKLSSLSCIASISSNSLDNVNEKGQHREDIIVENATIVIIDNMIKECMPDKRLELEEVTCLSASIHAKLQFQCVNNL